MRQLRSLLAALALVNLLLVGMAPAWALESATTAELPCPHGGEMRLSVDADEPISPDCADLAACCLGGVSSPCLPALDDAPPPQSWWLSGPLPPRPAATQRLLRPPIA